VRQRYPSEVELQLEQAQCPLDSCKVKMMRLENFQIAKPGSQALFVVGHTPGFRDSFKLTGFHTQVARMYPFIEGLEN
jgi:hypothetical protein